MTVRVKVLLLAVLLGTVLSGCSLRPMDLPLPKTRMGVDHYAIDVEFQSVLNLPLKTKVEVNGAQVGLMDSVRVHDFRATATLLIDNRVELPIETRVELQQHTILGDMFVSLIPPDNPTGRMLHDGDVIPIDQTKPADNIEDSMAAIVGWWTGGSIPFIQNLIVNLNKAFPENGAELQAFISKGSTSLGRIAETTDQFSTILVNSNDIMATLGTSQDLYEFLFSDVPGLLTLIRRILPDVIEAARAIGIDAATGAANILGPPQQELRTFFGVWTPIIQALTMSPNSVPRTLGAIDNFMRNKLVPFLSSNGRPNVIISDVVPETPARLLNGDPAHDRQVIEADNAQFRNQVVPVLRMLGMIR